MHHPALGTVLPNGSETPQYSQDSIKSQDPNPIKDPWDVMEHIQFHGGPTMTQILLLPIKAWTWDLWGYQGPGRRQQNHGEAFMDQICYGTTHKC